MKTLNIIHVLNVFAKRVRNFFAEKAKFLVMTLCVLALLLVACEAIVSSPQSDNRIKPTVVDEEIFDLSDSSKIGDEWAVVSFDELPFATEIPAGWTFEETLPEYILRFDGGLSGRLAFNKKGQEVPLGELISEEAELVDMAADALDPKVGLKVFCASEELVVVYGADGADVAKEALSGVDQECVVQIDGDTKFYPFVLSDKGIGEERLKEAWEIIRRIKAD